MASVAFLLALLAAQGALAQQFPKLPEMPELVAFKTSVDTTNSYSAAMMDLACKSDVLLMPSSTQEVAEAIKEQVGAAAAAGVSLKVRATHRNFHSTAPFVCPGTSLPTFPDWTNTAVPVKAWGAPTSPQAPPPASRTATLLLDDMRRVLATDAAGLRMRVQAGMLVTQLLAAADAAGMSVPLGAVPAFGDLTLGGVLVTGAHGSGHRTTSSLADIVVELTWVDAAGVVHTAPRDSRAAHALIGGLGVAGVVTELLLQLQPPAHVALRTYRKQSDAQLLGDVMRMLKESPHTLVVWRPDLKVYSGYLTHEVNASEPVTGGIVDLDFPKVVASGLGKAIQMWQEDVHDLLPLAALPVYAAVQEISVGHAMANRPDGSRMWDGVGESSKMQAASCGKKCLWHLGAKIAMDDLHFSIELERLGEWIDDVKAIIQADLWHHGLKRTRFLAPGYFWLRFGKGQPDFISHTHNMTAPVHVQMSFMKSIINPLVPIKHSWVYEVLEQLTLCKYKGKPHWGKLHERTFKHPACHVRDNLPAFDQLLAFQAESDPSKVFEPPLFADLAARKPASLAPRCSLWGQCFCAEDAHCAAGFKCKPSLAFPDYKACKLPGIF